VSTANELRKPTKGDMTMRRGRKEGKMSFVRVLTSQPVSGAFSALDAGCSGENREDTRVSKGPLSDSHVQPLAE